MMNIRLLVFLCVAVLCIKSLEGYDPFESTFGFRLRCYLDFQEGCNTELTDAYPQYSRSNDNLTKADTYIYLFTKDNVDEPELLHKCAGDTPPNTKFNKACRTEIFIPGFVSGVCNFAIYRELKNERLKCGCYNVILVDWMWGNSFDLIESRENMRIVAKHVVIVIRNLKKRFGLSARDFILTGHSYGAHMAGLIANEEEVEIINGLDPAGVTYTKKTPLEKRLDPLDAKCVQVIHTSAGQCLPKYFGVNFRCGTLDFWFNGGLFQKSCFLQTLISFIKGDFIYALFSLLPAACSHFQSLQYYKASMCPPEDGCQFLSSRCDNSTDNGTTYHKATCKSCGRNGENCAVAGAYACDCYLAGSSTGGDYCPTTRCKCPFCDDERVQKCGYSCNRTLTLKD